MTAARSKFAVNRSALTNGRAATPLAAVNPRRRTESAPHRRELCTPMLPALESALRLGERYWPSRDPRRTLRTGSMD